MSREDSVWHPKQPASTRNRCLQSGQGAFVHGHVATYQDGLAITRTLAERDPANAEWQRDLSVSWNKIGVVRRAQGNLEAALQAYQYGLAIARTLTERDPANAEWRRDMAMSLSHLVTLEGAGVSWGEVADAWEAMLRDGVLAPVDRPYLEEVRRLAGRRGD